MNAPPYNHTQRRHVVDALKEMLDVLGIKVQAIESFSNIFETPEGLERLSALIDQPSTPQEINKEVQGHRDENTMMLGHLERRQNEIKRLIVHFETSNDPPPEVILEVFTILWNAIAYEVVVGMVYRSRFTPNGETALDNVMKALDSKERDETMGRVTLYAEALIRCFGLTMFTWQQPPFDHPTLVG